uniref:Importin 11 n=1 Tax=Ornithorhynchus anatinus TaxID=9258 RepID=A0A6I8NCQ8_ORNAN
MISAISRKSRWDFLSNKNSRTQINSLPAPQFPVSMATSAPRPPPPLTPPPAWDAMGRAAFPEQTARAAWRTAGGPGPRLEFRTGRLPPLRRARERAGRAGGGDLQVLGGRFSPETHCGLPASTEPEFRGAAGPRGEPGYFYALTSLASPWTSVPSSLPSFLPRPARPGFASPTSVIQDKFCGIVNISVEGLHDVMTEDPETRTYKDCMLMSPCEEPKASEEEEEEPPTEQDKRKKRLALKDPVHTVSLQQFVYEKLKAQQELLGELGFQALMETVDTEIVTQLQEFLQGF